MYKSYASEAIPVIPYYQAFFIDIHFIISIIIKYISQSKANISPSEIMHKLLHMYAIRTYM